MPTSGAAVVLTSLPFFFFLLLLLHLFLSTGVTARCLEPQTPPNAYIIRQSPCEPGAPFTAGDFILYGCNDGYTLAGVPAIYCLRDNSWSELPQCLSTRLVDPTPTVTCGPPALPTNAYVMRHTSARTDGCYNVGDQVQFNCNDGFSCQQNSVQGDTITCQANGQWTQSALTCIPSRLITCTVPPVPDNAFILAGGRQQYSIGDYVQLTCGSGYVPLGVPTIQCLSDGSWTPARLVCQAILPATRAPVINNNGCRQPPVPANAYVINGSPLQPGFCYKPGDFIQYGCNPGYNVSGRATIQCQADGTWSDMTSFFCSAYVPPITCQNPEIPVNAYVVTAPPTGATGRYSVGDVIQYACQGGYDASGRTTRQCLNSGTWSSATLTCKPTVITCPMPDTPTNAYVTNFGSQKKRYFVGDVVQFACLEGFDPIGRATISCQSDGTWSSDVLVCRATPVFCKPPDLPANARILQRNNDPFSPSGVYNVGDMLTYGCNEGYTIMGTATTMCNRDGSWTPTFFVCQIIQCPQPQVPENAYILRTTSGEMLGDQPLYLPGDMVQYSCADDWTIFGLDTIVCMSDSSWSPTLMTCVKIITCPDPPTPINAHVIRGNALPRGSQYSIGDAITFACDDGFEPAFLGTNMTTQCMATGSWSQCQLYCVRVSTCGTPPPPPLNGFVTESLPPPNRQGRFLIGSTIRYCCNEGYSLSGLDTIRCSDSGNWSQQTVCCNKVFCQKPSIPPFTRLIGANQLKDQYSVGDTVQFTCGEGYTPSSLGSDNKLQCLPSGVWSQTTFSCMKIITCAQLPAPPSNAYVVNGGSQSRASFPVGTQVRYACYTGYAPSGNDATFCQPDGSWSLLTLCCAIINCRAPTLPKFTLPISGQLAPQYSVGDYVLFGCADGYKASFAPNENKVQCMSNGVWTQTQMQCTKIITCPSPPATPPNAHIVSGPGQPAYPGATVLYACNPGFDQSGIDSITCQDDGSWTLNTLCCSKITCPMPNLPRFTLPTAGQLQQQYNVGDTVGFTCADGYRATASPNDDRIQCQANGQWSQSCMVCQKIITCPALPSTPENAFLASGMILPSATSFPVGTSVRYRCNAGYELNGLDVITCQADGTWTPMTFCCNKITCIMPVLPQYTEPIGSRLALQYSVGDYVQFQCIDGYKQASFPSDNKIQCQANGQWSMTTFCCNKEITCARLPEPPDNAYVVSGSSPPTETSYPVGTIIRYACNTNYEPGGKDIVTCQADGSWSAIQFCCSKITCPMPTLPRFTQPTMGRLSTEYSIGDYVEFACMDGYTATASPTDTRTQCLATGDWSRSGLSCTKIITCPQLKMPPPNSYVSSGSPSASSYAIGSLIQYECNSGYQLVGEKAIICQDDGSWSQAAFNCVTTTCKEAPLAPRNAFLDQSRSAVTDGPNGYSIGDRVAFACLQGYKAMDGAVPQALCQSGGNWSPVTLICIKQQTCPSPSATPTNAYVRRADQADASGRYAIGSFVEYACYEEYRLEGASKVTCNDDGSWTPIAFCCIRSTCDAPTVPPNTHVILSGSSNDTTRYFVGDHVDFECDAGYSPANSQINTRITCQPGGRWSSDCPIICNKIKTCRDPVVPSNAYIVNCSPPKAGNSYYPGDFVQFSCNDGYTLANSLYNQINCQDDGTWSVNRARCELVVTCSVPSHSSPPNSYLVNSSPMPGINGKYAVGSLLQYACLEGFRQSGYGTISCLQSGQWSETTIQCTKTAACVAPLPPNNAYIANSSPPGEDRRYSANSFVQYACIDGYSPSGYATITCLPTGNWSITTFSCSRVVTCAAPLLPPNAYIANRMTSMRGDERYAVNDYVTLSCNPGGYTLSGGPLTITCQSDGSWTSTSMICTKTIMCLPPETPYNALVRESSQPQPGNMYSVGSYFVYDCAPGYDLSGGDNRLQCLNNGKWSGAAITCTPRPVTCVMPSNLPANAFILSGTSSLRNGRYSIGDVVRLGCSDGYEPKGCDTLECGANGQFSLIQMTCQRIVTTCPSPSPPPNAYLFGSQPGKPGVSRYSVGDSVTFICNDGFSAGYGGSSTAVCKDDGTWQGCDLVCQRNRIVTCSTPSAPPNSYIARDGAPIRSDQFSIGDSVCFSCNPGYSQIGDPRILCLNDGSWSSPTFTCQVIPVGCPDPACPRNAYLLSAPPKRNGLYSVGDVISFACKDGFAPSGSCNICCQEGGWTVSDFACTPLPPALSYLAPSPYPVFPSGGGQRQPPPPSLSLSLPSSVKRPTMTCPQPDLPSHSLLISGGRSAGSWPLPDKYGVGESVQYGCEQGYTIFGTIQCSVDGSWTSSSMTCQPTSRGFLTGSRTNRNLLFASGSCQAPVPPTHASPLTTLPLYQAGDFIQYACNTGYTVTGILACLRDGTWSAGVFTCKPTSVTMSSGSAFSANAELQVITATRDDDEEAARDASVEASGFFSGAYPSMWPVSCLSPRIPDYSQTVGQSVPQSGNKSSYPVGSFFIFQCNAGYKMMGDSTITCQKDGTWTDGPICLSNWRRTSFFDR